MGDATQRHCSMPSCPECDLYALGRAGDEGECCRWEVTAVGGGFVPRCGREVVPNSLSGDSNLH